MSIVVASGEHIDDNEVSCMESTMAPSIAIDGDTGRFSRFFVAGWHPPERDWCRQNGTYATKGRHAHHFC